MQMSEPSPRLLDEALSFAIAHGLVIAKSKDAVVGTNVNHAPFTLYPSPIPRECYKTAVFVTPALNTLVNRISGNLQYLREALQETADADEAFTGRLLDLVQPVKDDDILLSICRFDYFVNSHGDIPKLRMVEMNCIAASLAALASRTTELHRYIMSHPATASVRDQNLKQSDDLPQNEALEGVSRGIALAHEAFVKRNATVDSRCVVLFVVQPGERNAYDQQMLQIELWRNHNIEVVRASLADIAQHAHVDETRKLRMSLSYVGKDITVSVAYFRSGYAPGDYPTDKEWHARAVLERSNAVKCPSVAVQLVGTKKIQQLLDCSGEVERFINDSKEISAIRDTFATQLSLSPKENADAHAQQAIENPSKFVLKPQREGGGNNYYGVKLKQALQSMSPKERSGYILMERIYPVEADNIIVRDGRIAQTKVVSELGVFGIHLTCGETVLQNYVAGTLLRSKSSSQEDGGIAAGVAVLDSPLLTDK